MTAPPLALAHTPRPIQHTLSLVEVRAKRASNHPHPEREGDQVSRPSRCALGHLNQRWLRCERSEPRNHRSPG